MLEVSVNIEQIIHRPFDAGILDIYQGYYLSHINEKDELVP